MACSLTKAFFSKEVFDDVNNVSISMDSVT